MANQWHLQRAGKTLGPYSIDKLRQLAATGQLAPSDRVIGDGMNDWVTADSLDGIEFQSPTPRIEPVVVHEPARPVSTPRSAPRRNDRKTLWICVAVAAVVFAAAIGWIASSAFNSDKDADKPVAQNNSPTDTKQPVSNPQIYPPIPKTETKNPETVSSDNNSKPALDDLFNIPKQDTDAAPQVIKSPGDDPPMPKSPDGDLPLIPYNEPRPEPKPQEPPTDPKPQEPPVEPKPEPKLAPQPPPKTVVDTLRLPATLFQDLQIIRNPKFIVQGLPLEQQISYRILSQLQIADPDTDGIRRVDQVVLDTKLEKADDLSRAMFQTSLAALRGHQFSFKLNRLHEVLDFQGHKDNKKAAPVNALGGQGFLVTSVMDKDGWTEIAQLSFTLPKPQARIGETWRGQMTHDWGPLGSWAGSTTYALKSRQGSVSEIHYTYDMVYSPPVKGRGDLPFQINSAKFKPVIAAGVIQYSDQLGRVTVAVERFHVQGQLETVVLGQVAPIQMEEKQAIMVKLSEQNPWRQ